ncbi:neuronal acetylcholine receptor subunit alpha-6-like [Ruditapes philippinarum]|uniref:neuronal acetylcholine receptor subunit alpha-6-like n=1 Tax=Ruditapes philippinarum TaxID=129788 RepID=UPI00295BE343|nr:neuronal acetylcholine receptor subunit alpha-6-like [Ruditapes philippinarum]
MRYVHVAVIILLCLSSVRISYCVSYNNSVDLMRDVLDGYDARQRPVSDQSHPVVVTVSFYLLTIQEFNEVAAKFSVYGLLILGWNDQIITWDPKDYGMAYSALFRLSDVWYPKLVLTNPYTKLSDLGDDWMTIRIYNSGHTTFVPGAVFDTSCNADVTFYPFDTQICILSFNVWSYVGTEVYLHPTADEVLLDFFTENGEWDLENTRVQRTAGEHYTSDTLHFIFTIKRKPEFLIVNVVLPIVFMSIINILVFILPAESGERVGYSVTVLLALAVFMTLVGDNLPKTSEPVPILSYYLMILLILSTLMTVVTLLNLSIYFKTSQVPACLRSTFRILLCFPCKFGEKIDINNKVKPVDIKDECSIPAENKASINEPEITWQHISSGIDLIAMAFFLLCTIIINAVFLSLLSKNKDSAFNN